MQKRHFFKAVVAAVFLSCMAQGAMANSQPFPYWLQEFKREANAEGIDARLLDDAFAGVSPNPTIIRLDRKQPEGTMTLNRYLKNVVNGSRVQLGKQKYRQHKALLDEIGARYGVQPRFIVALWGIETNYGSNTGGFNLVEALATLAFDGRRSDFFRKELKNALRIVQEGHTTLPQFRGSWAGAMGQSQFMPSSFLTYAVDYNGDGHKDIWNTQADVFASIANYLHKVGWNDQLTWGREVRLPAGFEQSQADLSIKKSLAEWAAEGVMKADGSALPVADDVMASVVFPDSSGTGRAFLVYQNFDNILKWNRSKYFATAVGTLADQVAW
jgi:membrane-bound lytic murein transglycosylase B